MDIRVLCKVRPWERGRLVFLTLAHVLFLDPVTHKCACVYTHAHACVHMSPLKRMSRMYFFKLQETQRAMNKGCCNAYGIFMFLFINKLNSLSLETGAKL